MAHERTSIRNASVGLILAIISFLTAILQYLHRCLLVERIAHTTEGSPDEIFTVPSASVHDSNVHMDVAVPNDATRVAQSRVEQHGERSRPNIVPETEISQVPPRRNYAVVVGFRPGIYLTWEDCEPQVRGFRGNKFKSFKTREEAEEFLARETSKLSRSGGRQFF